MLHELGQMLLGIAVRLVGVPRAGQSSQQQSHQGDVFDVTGTVLGRSKQNHIHRLDGYLLQVNGVLDAQHGRHILDVVDGQPNATNIEL